MKLTARTLVSDGAGQLLAIVHDGNPSKIGLPGGGVDRGESLKQAAARELWEETGLRAGKLTPLVVVEEPNHVTYYYVAEAVTGTICASHNGPVVWATAEDLLSGKHAKHYRKVLAAAGRKWKRGC